MSTSHGKLYAVRTLLFLLVILNLIFIFGFSMQSAEESAEVSGSISNTVANVVVEDFENKPQEEKEEILLSIDTVIRKLAHMAEFASLAALALLLLSTWRIKLPWRLTASLGLVLVSGFTDELLVQMRSDGRSPQVKDVLIDLLGGAVGCCAALLLMRLLICAKNARKAK